MLISKNLRSEKFCGGIFSIQGTCKKHYSKTDESMMKLQEHSLFQLHVYTATHSYSHFGSVTLGTYVSSVFLLPD